MGVTLAAAPKTDDAMEIMPANWDSLMAFLECQTQWRVAAGTAGLVWLGLDYLACKLILDSVSADGKAFADLRIMEAAALPVLNEAD
ncbi:DUF1799 domain-containing protein [Neorhizobium petrolearium]|uniref:DUF1799 domain-containing protein n=1 Tax=Neorhizobium petrolearium TaxID=515361 RepID=UPI003F7DBABF